MLSETLQQELSRYAIGEKMRALRRQKGLRLAAVAKRSNLSTSLLSKIERGKSVPSILALQSIAAALDVTLAYFFPKPRRSAPALTRRKERIFLPESPQTKDSQYDFECLNFSAVEPQLNCYRALFRGKSGTRPHAHAGSEFLLVLTGSLQVSLSADPYLLEEGDSMYFESDVLHSYAKVSDGPCSALVVAFPMLPAVAGLDIEGARSFLRQRSNEIIWRRAG